MYDLLIIVQLKIKLFNFLFRRTIYGSLTIWQSKEEAEEAGAAIREKVMPELEAMATAPPEIKVMMVYEPSS